MEKILVIKLSAFGDFILALGAMEAIRRHHAGAHITLLTTRPFVDLATRSGYFDEVWVDARPRALDVAGWFSLFRRLNGGGFSRVYDLQLNDRTALYFRLFMKKPEWSGVVRGASHFFPDPGWRQMHAFARHRAMMAQAGIEMNMPDLSWMQVDVSALAPAKPYVLLVPGSAPTRADKRWPARRFAALALKLERKGFHVALIGTATEADVIAQIMRVCPDVKDLSGRTSLYDIATLAKEAAGAVGNDTGPLHLMSMAGCPVVALFGPASKATESAPVGGKVTIIETDAMEHISVDDVMQALHLQEADA